MWWEAKHPEMSYTNELIRNEYYTDVNYVFNFISEKEKPELLEYMEEKAAQTYFTVPHRISLSMSPMKPLKSCFRWRISRTGGRATGVLPEKERKRNTGNRKKGRKGKRYGEI